MEQLLELDVLNRIGSMIGGRAQRSTAQFRIHLTRSGWIRRTSQPEPTSGINCLIIKNQPLEHELRVMRVQALVTEPLRLLA